MNHSRNTVAAFLLAILSLAYACKTAEVTPTNRATLAAYQSARLQNDITVRVDSLRESRCPEGLACIWQGNVVVKATLSKDTDKQQIRLVLGPDFVAAGNGQKSDSTGVVLSGATYKVVLREVTPYPSTVKPAQAPTQAVIEVSRL